MTRLAAAVAILLAAAPASANEHLERANEALDGLEFEAARAALNAALRAGDNDPSELAEIHMLSGIVAASFGDASAARESFRRLLSIDPQATLGKGYAPKIVAPFEAAKASMDEALVARYEPYAFGDEQIVVVIESDPAELVHGAVVLFRDADGEPHRVRATGARQIDVPLPALPVGKVRIGVVDEHGNRLAVIVWDAPLDDAEPAPPVAVRDDAAPAEPLVSLAAEDEPASTPLYERWQVWAGASVALAAFGTYHGLKTLDAQRELEEILVDSEQYEYEDAVAVLDRGNRHALFANIGFGAAIVSTAVSGYLYFRRDDDSGPRVSATPLRGGGAVTWEVPF